MRRHWFPCLLPAALAACGSDAVTNPPPPGPHAPRVLTSSASIADGPPSDTLCVGAGQNSNIDGPHFDTIAVTFADPGGDPAVCGNLTFNGRTRTFEVEYASGGAAEDNPWKYWWRRGRNRLSGSTQNLTELRRDSVPAFQVIQTGNLGMPLSVDYDGVGALLILTSQAGLQLTDSAFLYGGAEYEPALYVEYRLQHWRQIPAPTLDSARATGTTVTLWWHNNHQGRSIDSTIVFRNGAQVGPHLGATATTWQDTGLTEATYTYRLKHFTPEIVMNGGLAFPNSPASNSRQVTVEIGACATAEYLSTWKVADQYLSAGCSELGTNKRFRWFKAGGVPLTAWTSDTLFDFAGHTLTGTQIVVLKDSNTTTGATSVDTLPFTVSNYQVVLEGPTYIPDKTTKLYYAYNGGPPTGHSGQWFESYDDGLQWYPATASNQDSLARIWPMGEYTVDLRQHRVLGGILRRGRLFIEVCSTPGCGAAAPVVLTSAASVTEASTDWGVFGAGPWIGWGGSATRSAFRLYDLWGVHDRASPFTDAAWIAGSGGRFTDAETEWDVTWAGRDLGLADVRAFDFTVAGAGARPYVFGFAVDSDLGPNAADDVASWDARRGLVLVADASRAVGFLLRDAAGNALASVQEYGVGRWAPTTADYAWAAQRAAGVQLVGTPRDVQVVLSAGETVGDATWQFIAIRGDSPAAIQATADVVLRRLR